jgi:hypothetical protein
VTSTVREENSVAITVMTASMMSAAGQWPDRHDAAKLNAAAARHAIRIRVPRCV